MTIQEITCNEKPSIEIKVDDIDYKQMIKEICEYVKLNNELLSKLVNN